jgi:hypothetical protein
MKITSITRRDISDAITVEKINWAGRLEEPEFLARIFPLEELPSHDSRFTTASGDIWQHRINNSDWSDEWVFSDPRFNLNGCDDDLLLRFLCESLHPVVRSDITEVERLLQLYNSYLRSDGFELVEKSRLSNRPIFVGRYVGIAGMPGITAVKAAIATADLSYVAQQITRMEAAVNADPGLAIGTAKELVETCCKTILSDRGITDIDKLELAQLVKKTSKELKLTPDDISDSAKAADVIKRLLSNLATITQGVAELRNQYGTGHGRTGRAKGLEARHAKLAVGAASTLAVFLIETHDARTIDDRKS